MGGQASSGQYGQSTYTGQMGGGYGGMGNYGASQGYGGYGSYGGGQYNPQNQYGARSGYSQQNYGYQPQNYGMWGGGMPSYGQMGQQSQYVSGQQPAQGNTPTGLNLPGAQPELRNAGNPAVGVGGGMTGGPMPPQQPPPLNSTQILMNRAKAMQAGETPPYVPPQQAQPQIAPQTIAPPSYQQQWQAQLKAAQDQLNMGGAQYGQPKADDGSNYRDQNGNYYLETAPSTLDPGSMAGLQAWLGGSNSPFGITVPQQQQGYTDWYNQTYGQQAPGGPTRY